MSPVSAVHSQIVYDALKACGVRLMSALPETWLVHLIRLAEDDPEMILEHAIVHLLRHRRQLERWAAT